MSGSYCGSDCVHCGLHALCRGCTATCGKPFGKPCFAARYIRAGGIDSFEVFKKLLAEEADMLAVPGMPKVTELVPINGRFLNMNYRLPGGQHTPFLDDDAVYLACQLPCDFDEGRFFSVVAGPDYLLVSLCGSEGMDGELLAYRRR